mmetsp:Transcript_26757/g.84947  ORF Transcript_26757/g.84947 Transcript_26757/m.84947 type:complete len:238 (+) Transcript_26757:1148-1861(+)
MPAAAWLKGATSGSCCTGIATMDTKGAGSPFTAWRLWLGLPAAGAVVLLFVCTQDRESVAPVAGCMLAESLADWSPLPRTGAALLGPVSHLGVADTSEEGCRTLPPAAPVSEPPEETSMARIASGSRAPEAPAKSDERQRPPRTAISCGKTMGIAAPAECGGAAPRPRHSSIAGLAASFDLCATPPSSGWSERAVRTISPMATSTACRAGTIPVPTTLGDLTLRINRHKGSCTGPDL